MLKRIVPAVLVLAACSTGASDESPSSFSASFTANDQGDGDGDESSDTGDGDGDPDPSTTGDGDPDPTTTTTGDGDGDPSTTGDGDGDGDGDVDLCPLICDGQVDSTPTSCDAPYVIGRTQAKAGFMYGGNTQSSSNSDTERCGPNSDPSNWDSGYDHFFRIYLVEGDIVTAVQNPNGWDARLKIHDEATCIGNAKECSVDADPAEIVHEALKTDWYTIVVDGQSLGFMDWGDYTLSVNVTTGAGIDECGCP